MTAELIEHAPCGWCATNAHSGCVVDRPGNHRIACGCHDRGHRAKETLR